MKGIQPDFREIPTSKQCLEYQERIQEAFDDIKAGVDCALACFQFVDRELLVRDACERSITHKIAEHLQHIFPDWNVDCEYNRDKLETKRLEVEIPDAVDDTDVVTVYPDIIVHKRGRKENLLVIEAKKENRRNSDFDKEKLRAFTCSDQYDYCFGLFILIKSDLNDPLECEWFKNNNQLKSMVNEV